MKKKILSLSLLICASILFLAGCGNPSPDPSKPDKVLDFYYINDTHGAFIRQDTDTNYNEAGMSYIGEYLIERKQLYPESTVILSGGDMFQGGFESNMTDGAIMADAMNIIGFDAMALGNHEFDWGEDKMKANIANLNFPVLSCNTFYDGASYVRPDYLLPYKVIVKDGIKIGIIGAARENMQNCISGSISSKFVFPKATSYIKIFSDALRNEQKCDLVLVIYHDSEFDESLTNISSVSGKKYVDGIFLAHDHRYKSGEKNKVPYLESGCNGRYIGNIQFIMKYNQSSSSYEVYRGTPSNKGAYSLCKTPNSEIDNLLVKYKDVIGDRNEVIATLKKSYTKAEFAELAAKAMYLYVNEHKEIFGGVTVYLSTHNISGVRANVSKGDLTLGQFFSVFPFDNYLCIQSSTQTQVDYMKTDEYYAWYGPNTPTYVNNHTNCVTINFIAENETYGYLTQDSFIKYETITAKQVLYEYLKSGRE